MLSRVLRGLYLDLPHLRALALGDRSENLTLFRVPPDCELTARGMNSGFVAGDDHASNS